MPYLLDFTGLPDQDPYVNADLTFLDNDAEIVSGTLGPTSGRCRFIYNVEEPPSGTIVSRVTLSRGPNDGDYVGPAILKSNGEGYYIKTNFDQCRIRSTNSAGSDNSVGDSTNQAVAAGDELELQLDTATGELRSYLNGTLLNTRTNTTYSQGDSSGNFYVGGSFNRLNNGGDNITEFFSPSVNNSTGPSIDDIDGDNEVRAGQQNVVITGTNIENATSVTLGGQNMPIV